MMERLENVLDPCSCSTNSPVNIVELGLVEDVTVDGGAARVKLLPTSPMCHFVHDMSIEIQNELKEIPGINSVHVSQEHAKIWDEDRMDPSVREAREKRIRERMYEAGIEPHTYDS